MRTYHNDPKIKEKYLARVRTHILADELIYGQYWEDGKGCAVGCTIHGSSHAAYETELGIPRILAKLEDSIFEGMRNGRSKQWPEQFLSVIPVGADLSNVWPQFAHWMLLDDQWGVLQFAKSKAIKKSIQDIGKAYGKMASGKAVTVDWNKLRAAASAAAYAAYAAAYAAADAASDADADADAAAAYAAYAAADACAAYATKERWHEAQADKLLELMAACHV